MLCIHGRLAKKCLSNASSGDQDAAQAEALSGGAPEAEAAPAHDGGDDDDEDTRAIPPASYLDYA